MNGAGAARRQVLSWLLQKSLIRMAGEGGGILMWVCVIRKQTDISVKSNGLSTEE